MVIRGKEFLLWMPRFNLFILERFSLRENRTEIYQNKIGVGKT